MQPSGLNIFCIAVPHGECSLMPPTGASTRIVVALAVASMAFPRKRLVQNFTRRFRAHLLHIARLSPCPKHLVTPVRERSEWSRPVDVGAVLDGYDGDHAPLVVNTVDHAPGEGTSGSRGGSPARSVHMRRAAEGSRKASSDARPGSVTMARGARSEAAGGLGDEAAEPGVRGVVLVLAVPPQRL